MAQKFLDGAQFAPAREQVRGEGVAQRVRRRGLGQAERAAQLRDRQLDDARRQRAAPRADEQRPLRREMIRAELQVVLDARRTAGIAGTVRTFRPLPVTVTASDGPIGASWRVRPSASEMRRPAP